MVITFTADEVFEMAIEIERSGAELYREAAEKSSDGKTRKTLFAMAQTEEGHRQAFEQMRKELAAENETAVFDPDNRSVMYLQTMADARGWEGKVNPTQELSGNETPRQILDIALNSEKESVVFYLGLKDLISSRAGKKKVEQIIIEELAHISELLGKLKSLK